MVQCGAPGQHNEVCAPVAKVTIGGNPMGSLHSAACVWACHHTRELPADGLPLAVINSWSIFKKNPSYFFNLVYLFISFYFLFSLFLSTLTFPHQ